MHVIVYPEPRLRAPSYYRGQDEARDMQLGPPQGISWRPRPLRPFALPAACRLYWQAPATTESVPPPAEEPGVPLAWRRPITYQPQPIPIWFNGNIGEDVPATTDEPEAAGQAIRPMRPAPPPRTLYLFTTASAADQPVQPHTQPRWQKPLTYKPYQPAAMLRQILYNLANPEPGPQAEGQQYWQAKPFRPSRPILRYLFNPARDQVDEAPGQFQVFWSYQTKYEATVRQLFLRGLKAGTVDGVQIPESPAFPGFVVRPIKLTQVPTIARHLYRQAPPQDFDRTPEGPTFESFTNRRMWPWTAPKGAYMYYRSGFGKDEPDPLPTPTGGGRLPVIYMRRLELLGVRLGISAG